MDTMDAMCGLAPIQKEQTPRERPPDRLTDRSALGTCPHF